MTVGTKTIRSEPDAVICKFFPTDVLQFTEKVIAVVHVEVIFWILYYLDRCDLYFEIR